MPHETIPTDRSSDTLFIPCKISIANIQIHELDTIRPICGSCSVFGLTVSPDGRYGHTTHEKFMEYVLSGREGFLK